MNAAEFATEGRRLSTLLDEAQDQLKAQVQKAADAERDYRKAKGEAWARAKVEMSGTTAKHREAWVDAETADLRYLRDLADGMRRAAGQAIESRRQQLSLLQSVMNAYKAEAGFDRFGPEMAA